MNRTNEPPDRPDSGMGKQPRPRNPPLHSSNTPLAQLPPYKPSQPPYLRVEEEVGGGWGSRKYPSGKLNHAPIEPALTSHWLMPPPETYGSHTQLNQATPRGCLVARVNFVHVSTFTRSTAGCLWPSQAPYSSKVESLCVCEGTLSAIGRILMPRDDDGG
ncbi:hypothetical protein D9613_011228 [Agrocybe pediades]|uniref:Uncharacterized protein n=1 Tax=Agrocybe pediades TaxID=84607 RepID=A0A8H4VQA6_9AGAR|nr:hypothetical protein D9613_011228 [Agrocybe pediades]